MRFLLNSLLCILATVHQSLDREPKGAWWQDLGDEYVNVWSHFVLDRICATFWLFADIFGKIKGEISIHKNWLFFIDTVNQMFFIFAIPTRWNPWTVLSASLIESRLKCTVTNTLGIFRTAVTGSKKKQCVTQRLGSMRTYSTCSQSHTSSYSCTVIQCVCVFSFSSVKSNLCRVRSPLCFITGSFTVRFLCYLSKFMHMQSRAFLL